MLAQETNATREARSVQTRDLQLETREGLIEAGTGDGEVRSSEEAE